MKMGAILALSLALLGIGFSAAESRERIGRHVWHGDVARARHYAHAPTGRHVYWVLRSPRFYPAPTPPDEFFFAFWPTNRVNTHMY